MLMTCCIVSRQFVLQFLGTFHQCVKRELPYEAVHLYQKIKQAEEGKPDLALCNGLLNVAVGRSGCWQRWAVLEGFACSTGGHVLGLHTVSCAEAVRPAGLCMLC